MLSGKDVVMPKSPSGKKRPADVASNAVHVMRLATGDIKEVDVSSAGVDGVAIATIIRWLAQNTSRIMTDYT